MPKERGRRSGGAAERRGSVSPRHERSARFKAAFRADTTDLTFHPDGGFVLKPAPTDAQDAAGGFTLPHRPFGTERYISSVLPKSAFAPHDQLHSSVLAPADMIALGAQGFQFSGNLTVKAGGASISLPSPTASSTTTTTTTTGSASGAGAASPGSGPTTPTTPTITMNGKFTLTSKLPADGSAPPTHAAGDGVGGGLGVRMGRRGSEQHSPRGPVSPRSKGSTIAMLRLGAGDGSGGGFDRSGGGDFAPRTTRHPAAGSGADDAPGVQRVSISDLSNMSWEEREAMLQSEELVERQRLMDLHSDQCSKILDFIYLGGQTVAGDLGKLQANGITHVLNCAGTVCPDYHEGTLEYKTLYLLDSKRENISCMFYEVLEYIEHVKNVGGRVYVHCHAGVSRSASMVICYIMWSYRKTYDQAYAMVRRLRGVVNPNVGFTVQLSQWWKRHNQGVTEPILYTITKHNPSFYELVVHKPEPYVTGAALNTEHVLLLHTPSCLWLWIGDKAGPEYIEGAHKTISRLQQYEHASEDVVEIREGAETAEFWAAMGGQPSEAEVQRYLMTVAHSNVRAKDRSADEFDQGDGTDVKTKSELFEYPDWELIEQHEANDLRDDGLFVLFVTRAEGNIVFVWVGAEWEDADMDPEEAGLDFQELYDLDPDATALKVVQQEDEDEEFEDFFWTFET